MLTLRELHLKKSGKVSDKWDSYLDIYERVLQPYRREPVNVLEIGVQNGGSLEIWAQYFASATRIVGCDVDEKCGQLSFADSRIQVVVGDATKADTCERLRRISQSFEVIIDDGSHRSADVLETFFLLFESLSPGGLYVIEDTHALYWPQYGGGVEKKDSASLFFKALTDILNHEHWRETLPVSKFFRRKFGRTPVPRFVTEGSIHGLEFYNSIVIVRKAPLGQDSHSKLGPRRVVGSEASVNPEILTY